MKLGITSDTDLKALAEKAEIPNFGVYLQTELPSGGLKDGQNVIINMDDDSTIELKARNGTHWIAVCRIGDQRYYFDSFGVTPDDSIAKWCGKPLKWNDKQIQHISSDNCGAWSLMFLDRMADEETFEDIIDDFSGEDQELNEMILSYYRI